MTNADRTQIVKELAKNYGVTQVDLGYADSPIRDAFGRLRTAEPFSIFSCQQEYDKQPLIFDEKLTGSGSTIHNADQSTTEMSVTTANGDAVIRQTFNYFHYQPGKSHLILLTGVFGVGKDNVQQSMGYFDTKNGVFLRLNGEQLEIILRSSSTGSIVDTIINQDNWNFDTFDGSLGKNNPSKVTLDITRGQLLWIDLEWLSIGRVRVGFIIDGQMWPAHEFRNANIVDGAYMSTANLPVRYEITNVGITASSTTLKHICCSVISEGGHNVPGIPHSVSNGSSLISVTTRRPILSIRPKFTFQGIENRIVSLLASMATFSVSQSAFIELVYGGSLTTPSWADVDTNFSGMEFDVSSAAITGGHVLNSYYLAASSTGNRESSDTEVNGLSSLLPIALNIDGNDSTVISIVATSITTVTDVGSSLHWDEIY